MNVVPSQSLYRLSLFIRFTGFVDFYAKSISVRDVESLWKMSMLRLLDELFVFCFNHILSNLVLYLIILGK